MEEQKIFGNGGMNLDDAPQYIQTPDYVEAFNLETGGNIENEAGDGTNLATTVEVLGYTLPTGLNKCIGATPFENKRKAYFLIYNSFGYHQLAEYDYDTNTKSLLFTDITDSGGVSIMPLTPINYVMDIKIAEPDLLIFTDSNIPINYINISRLKSGEYGTLTVEDFSLIKAQPLSPPKAVYGDDISRVVNLMKEKLFMFRNKYNYLDFEPSAYSSFSKMPVPSEEMTTSVGEDVTKNNNITVSANIGSNRVVSIDFIASYSDLDWFTIKSVTRTYILALTATEIDIPNGVLEAYDPVTNIYSFVFYNDGLYENVNPIDTDLEYDYVPNKAETLELVNGNVLDLAGITEGYPRPVDDFSISVSSYDPHLEVPTPNYDNLVVSYTNTSTDGSFPFQQRYIINVEWGGLPKVGDVLTIVTVNVQNPAETETYTYTVPFGQTDNLVAVVNSFQATIPDSYVRVSPVNPAFRGVVFKGVRLHVLKSATIQLASVGSGVSKSIHSLKMNSSYQLARQYYDVYGRPFPLLTGNNYIVKTQSYAQSKGLPPSLTWQINSPAPAGAASFHILISENNTHQNTLYINGKLDLVDGGYITIFINPLKVFNERNKSSILNYEYSPGDRVTFNYYMDGATKVWFDDPYIDVEVVAFDIVVDTSTDPDTTNYVLKTRLNSSMNPAILADKILYMELYTPKQRIVTEGSVTTYKDNVFYQIGEQYKVVNGVHEVTTGIITEGDVYFKTRDLVSPIDLTTYSTYTAEDFNFSDFYKSNYNSYGRAFQYNERDGVKVRGASMRYSDKRVIDSEFNLINRFYPERIYGEGDGETSIDRGIIRKIRQRGNYLVCLQESGVGHIPVANTIVEDQVGQEQAFLSDKLFNKIRYSQTGFYGIGNARESFSESPNGTMYFVDPNKSVPMREGYDGLRVITQKLAKFFKRTLQAAKKAGRSIITIWNDYNNRSIYSMQVLGDEIVAIPINEFSLKYQDDYTILPTDITITQAPTKGTMEFTGGQWIYTSDEGETGSDTLKFSFVVDGNLIEKNLCITIEAGDATPFAFNFIDLINQELSTLLESNAILIGGINIPSPISIVGGEYRINEGAWTSVAGTVVNGDSVQVRQTSSASYATTTSATLTVGGYSDAFDVTTKTDIEPDPFAFTPVTDAELSTVYPSNIVTMAGLGAPSPISIVDGEYQINGGSWTFATGFILNGDTLRVRRESSADFETPVITTVNVGGFEAPFSITTKDESLEFISEVTGGTPQRGVNGNDGGVFPSNAPYQWDGSLANDVIIINELPGVVINGWLSSSNHVLTTTAAGTYKIKVVASGSITFFNDVSQNFYGFADFLMTAGGTTYSMVPMNPPMSGFAFYYQYYSGLPVSSGSHREATVAYSFTFEQDVVLGIGGQVALYVSPRYSAVLGTPGTVRINNGSMRIEMTKIP